MIIRIEALGHVLTITLGGDQPNNRHRKSGGHQPVDNGQPKPPPPDSPGAASEPPNDFPQPIIVYPEPPADPLGYHPRSEASR